MKTALPVLAAALALGSPLPVLAQGEAEQIEESDASTDADDAALQEAMKTLGAMFPTEPLTAEQEARLPLAQKLVATMIPEGTMGEIMGTMLDDMLGPLMEMGPPQSKSTVAKNIGVTAFELDLTDEQAAELAALFDPAWKERNEREMAMVPQMMREIMTLMEPGMRKAMSELYAINFSTEELAEVEAFFATETGAKYARKSFAMASDPRMMSASMEAMPAMMGMLGDLEARVEESTADLPPPRAFSELDPEEQQKIAQMAGLTVEQIEENIAIGEMDWEDETVDEAAEAAEEAAN
ncbi:DUF2059 domain-containing protein [Erythrobacter sp. GH1-10]|uniref:DUF2059 domain-containing protein n=1 Tax=Erythrobacter sp. GH1-10 TaxID=3349334 RepID=UPI003877A80B